MSTANKLTYLNTTKTKIKSAINLTGANLTNETFRQYPQKLYDKFIDIINIGTDGLYNNMPKITRTGTELTLNNTAGAPMKIGLSSSDSTQETTTGKNMFNKNGTKEQYYYDSNGVKTYDVAEHYYINQIYDNINFSSICISFSNAISYASVRVCEYNSGGTFIKRTLVSTNGQSLNLDNNTSKVIFSTNAADDLGFVDLQIEKGSTATSYEEYTNGASPNPDYPQDINVVTGNNTIKIEGDNQFNINGTYVKGYFDAYTGNITTDNNTIVNISNGTISITGTDAWRGYISDYVEIESNYNLSFDGNISDIYVAVAYYNSSKEYISRQALNSTSETLVIPTNAKYLKFIFEVREANKEITISNIKLMKTNEIVNYPLSLNTLELAKIGSHKDEIFQNTTDSIYYDSNLTLNGWYKKKRIGKYTFDGTENWTIVSGSNAPFRYILNDMKASTNDGITPLIKCTHFIPVYWNATFTNYESLISNQNSTQTLSFRYSLISSLNDWKDWLSNNNIIVYYPLATPTDEQITDTTLISQLNAIKNAISYANETNISQTNANRPFMINASAIKNSME